MQYFKQDNIQEKSWLPSQVQSESDGDDQKSSPAVTKGIGFLVVMLTEATFLYWAVAVSCVGWVGFGYWNRKQNLTYFID